jgi:hypothetical protein
MDLIALVPADLEDLLPTFLENRWQDVEKLRIALPDADFALLQHLGERMYALGNPYGFRQITTFGRQIREACAVQDDVSIKQVLEQYEDYLDKVKISIVPEPAERAVWKRRPPPATAAKNDAGTSKRKQGQNDAQDPSRWRKASRTR